MRKELTGTEIARVGDLSAANAHRVIEGLEARVRDAGRQYTGNAWTDRDEETWIDRL